MKNRMWNIKPGGEFILWLVSFSSALFGGGGREMKMKLMRTNGKKKITFQYSNNSQRLTDISFNTCFYPKHTRCSHSVWCSFKGSSQGHRDGKYGPLTTHKPVKSPAPPTHSLDDSAGESRRVVTECCSGKKKKNNLSQSSLNLLVCCALGCWVKFQFIWEQTGSLFAIKGSQNYLF